MTGTPLQDLLAAVTGLAFVAVMIFVLAYARLSWWRSGMGRTIMAAALAIALLTGVGVVRRVDLRWDAVHLTTPLAWGSIVAYLAVAAVWGWWALIVLRDRDEGD